MIVLFSLSAGTVSNPAFSLPDEPPVPIVVIEDYAAVAADVGLAFNTREQKQR